MGTDLLGWIWSFRWKRVGRTTHQMLGFYLASTEDVMAQALKLRQGWYADIRQFWAKDHEVVIKSRRGFKRLKDAKAWAERAIVKELERPEPRRWGIRGKK